jgi:hypothetical protein
LVPALAPDVATLLAVLPLRLATIVPPLAPEFATLLAVLLPPLASIVPAHVSRGATFVAVLPPRLPVIVPALVTGVAVLGARVMARETPWQRPNAHPRPGAGRTVRPVPVAATPAIEGVVVEIMMRPVTHPVAVPRAVEHENDIVVVVLVPVVCPAGDLDDPHVAIVVMVRDAAREQKDRQQRRRESCRSESSEQGGSRHGGPLNLASSTHPTDRPPREFNRDRSAGMSCVSP